MPTLRKLFGPSKAEIWRQLSAETGRSFQHGDPARDVPQEKRRGEPGYPRADDRDMRLTGIAHPSTLAEARAAGRAGPRGGPAASPVTGMRHTRVTSDKAGTFSAIFQLLTS